MIAKQLELLDTPDIADDTPDDTSDDTTPVMHYRRNDDGTVTQWFDDNGQRHEFKPFIPGPNWKRWVDGLPLCVTIGDWQQVFRLEEG